MQLNKKNRKYWQGRFEQLQESLLNKSDTYYDDLDRIYKMANMDIQNQIAPLFASVREQIAVNVAENKYLAQLRDTLLPKLMSGEVSVDSIRL